MLLSDSHLNVTTRRNKVRSVTGKTEGCPRGDATGYPVLKTQDPMAGALGVRALENRR